MEQVIKIRNVGSVKLNIDRLLAVERECGKHYVTYVGIMGSKNSRTNVVETKRGIRKKGKEPVSLTNAEIGLKHEKGSLSEGIPRRSFLVMPLEMKMPRFIIKLGQKVIDGLTKENIHQAYVDLGILAEKIIDMAFASGGFGHWAKNTPYTIRKKHSSNPLIDSGQLRRSITHRVASGKI